MSACACRSKYEAAIRGDLVPLLASRDALLERIDAEDDVALPTFRPGCVRMCDEAKSLVRLIAAQRV